MSSTFYKIPGIDLIWENPVISLELDTGGKPIIKDVHLSEMTIVLVVNFSLEYESPNEFKPDEMVKRKITNQWDCGPIEVESLEYNPIKTQERFLRKLSEYKCDSEGNYINV